MVNLLVTGPSGRVTATITELLTALPKFLPPSLLPPLARMRSAVDRAPQLERGGIGASRQDEDASRRDEDACENRAHPPF